MTLAVLRRDDREPGLYWRLAVSVNQERETLLRLPLPEKLSRTFPGGRESWSP